MSRLAKFVSALFNPLVYVTLLLAALMWTRRPAAPGPYMWAWVLLAGFPGALLAVGIRRGIWSDFDVTQLHERKTYLPWVLGASAVLFVSAWVDGYPSGLRFVVTGVFLWLFISMGFSVFWKISMHVGATTGVVWMVLAVFGLVPFLCLVWSPPLVAWARLYLHKHDRAQVLGGAAAATLAIWVAATLVHP